MLEAAGTWVLEEPPPGANVISSKWVFKAKKDTAGLIAWFKAQLVAQGFSQIGGVDYDDTYAPIACLASSRAIIVMANCLGLELHQVDIKGAYLNGELNDNKVLYMQHPPGYKARDMGTHVLCLRKTLYGLKQSGHRWYQKLLSIFKSLHFSKCSVDQAVFYKTNKAMNKVIVVAVHVDDCTIAASNLHLIEDFKAGLCQHVKVTDLGELHWMLGVEIKRDCKAGTIHLSQHAYIESILHCYNFDDLKPLSIPMDPAICLMTKQAPTTMAEHVIMCNTAICIINWTRRFFSTVCSHLIFPNMDHESWYLTLCSSCCHASAMAPHLSKDLRDRVVQWRLTDQKTYCKLSALAGCSIGTISNILRYHHTFGQSTNPLTCQQGCTL